MSIAKAENSAVIVPVYNGENSILELLNGICKTIDKSQIIIVDDGSEDNSYNLCKDNGYYTLRLDTNMGKGYALQKGFKIALKKGFEFAFTIDCDLQHDPACINRFFKKQNLTLADVVIGKRDFSFGKMPLARIFSNSMTSFILSLVTGQKLYDSQCGYRLYRLEKIRNLKFDSHRYQFESEILLKLSKHLCRFDYVCIPTIYNNEISYISHIRDIKNFIKIVFKNI